jgi:hypothetical protein
MRRVDEAERVEETAEFFQLDDSVRDHFVSLYPHPPCHLYMFFFLAFVCLPTIVVIHHHHSSSSTTIIITTHFFVLCYHTRTFFFLLLDTSTSLWHGLSRTQHIPQVGPRIRPRLSMPIKVVTVRKGLPTDIALDVGFPNVVVQTT